MLDKSYRHNFNALELIALMIISFVISICYLIFQMPLYFFLSLLLLVIIGVYTFNPFYGLLSIIILSVEEMSYLSVKTDLKFYYMRFYPYLIAIFFTFIGWISLKIRREKDLRITTPLDGILIFVVGYSLFSLVWTPIPKAGIYLAIMLLLNLFAFYLFSRLVTDEQKLKQVINYFIVASVIIAIGIVVARSFTWQESIELNKNISLYLAFEKVYNRPGGFSGPHHGAGLMTYAAAFIIGKMALENSRKIKSLYFLLLLFLIMAIIMTKVRSITLGLIIGLASFLWLHPKFRGKLISYTFLGAVIIVILILTVEADFLDRILLGLGYSGQFLFSEDKYFSGASVPGEVEGATGYKIRLYWWGNGLRAMIEDPLKLLIGLGMGGLINYADGAPEVSNIFLAFFFDMGLIGIIVLLFIVYILIRNIYFCLKNGQRTYSYCMLIAITAGLITDLAIHGLVDYDLNSYGSKNVWFPLGLCMAVINILKKEIKRKEEKE